MLQSRSQTAVSASEIEATSAPYASPAIVIDDRRVIGNTGGLGVRFRQEPRQDAPSSVGLADGATVHVVEQLTPPDSELWWKVRLDDGTIGYIKDRYLLH